MEKSQLHLLLKKKTNWKCPFEYSRPRAYRGKRGSAVCLSGMREANAFFFFLNKKPSLTWHNFSSLASVPQGAVQHFE